VPDETFDIAHALLALDAPGTFAVRLQVPADDLQLHLHKVGPIEFPISAAAVSRMLALATRSPFGWGEHTITDPAVRSGWELRKARIKIDARRWNPALREHLVEIREQLGLPDTGRLRATLDKLTIYGPGEFFAQHQDTEKDDDMIASLVVLLPSSFGGGALRCARGDQQIEFRRTERGAEQLELIAFYADCHHEIRPVKRGHRVALVYRLGFETDSHAQLAAPSGSALERLEQAVAEHFDLDYEKLVVLLDHQYTPRNLGWSRLKHHDRVRAAALREVAERLGLDVYLALANIHEGWQCSPSLSSYHSRRGRWSDDDDGDDEGGDDEDGDEEDYTLEDMYESSVSLRHWRTPEDLPAAYDELAVADNELCFTKANDALEPFESDYQGYMGNYGDTLDRWYHRAAIVMWPKTNAFLVEARLDPHEAIRQLLASATAGRSHPVQDALLDVWAECVGDAPKDAMVADLFRLAAALDDPDTAAAFIRPAKPEKMATSAIAPLLRATGRHGYKWCETLLTGWHAESRSWWLRGRWRSTYSHAWLARLVDGDEQLGPKIAAYIVAQQWHELQEQPARPARERSPYAEGLDPARLESIVGLLTTSALAGARDIHDGIVAALTAKDSGLSALELASVSVSVHERIDVARRSEWDTERLLHHAKLGLAAALARPARESEDWRIIVPQSCPCGDCTILHAFLGSGEIGTAWPLVTAQRQHIHQIIDSAGLPVNHVTERRGRPFKLVLTKRIELFRLDAKHRDEQEKMLGALSGLDELHEGGSGWGRCLRALASRRLRMSLHGRSQHHCGTSAPA
jgi:hypothetical protein